MKKHNEFYRNKKIKKNKEWKWHWKKQKPSNQSLKMTHKDYLETLLSLQTEKQKTKLCME